MPQFDLANATISSTMVDDILYPLVGYVPFVYDDLYPTIITHHETREDLEIDDILVDAAGNKISAFYFYNDPINSSSYTTGNVFYKREQNYSHTNFGHGGRVPYNPRIHKFVGGQLRVGLGTSAGLLNPVLAAAYKVGGVNEPYLHSQSLYYSIYEDGIQIDGTSYTFPVSHNATVGSGGFWLPKSGTGNGSQVTNADISFKYTGDDNSSGARVMSYTFAKQLAEDVIKDANGIAASIKTAMTGSEDAFPYDSALAQQHFDIMCGIAYHKGISAFLNSSFLHQYKQVDGTAVTSSSGLSAYDNAAYQLPWFTAKAIHGVIGYRMSYNLAGKYQTLINTLLTGSGTNTTHNLNRIAVPLPGTSDSHTSITLNPFTLNNISFPLHQPISAADLVEGLPVIFCTDDQGHYYIPGTGFNTIDESGGMLPGKGYQVLIGGSETLEFTYSEPSSDNLGRNLAVVGASENYEITRTGVSHPMVINQITGTVSEGDELVAYANGIPVGVAPVDVDGSTLLVAWKSLYEYGLDTDGYQDGDDIEIRLFSQEYGQELRVMADLNVSTYGESPITMGSIHVLNELAVPVEFGLEQNYPNPFNPSTTIDVSVASDSYIMLNVYDINGRLISTLADDTFDTGYHSFVWNGLDQSGNKVSAGIYFYSLQTNEMTLTKKMILMK